MKLVEFTYRELIDIKASLEKNLQESKKEMNLLEDAISELHKIVSKRNGQSIFVLPQEILKLSDSKAKSNSRIEWKKVVYEVVKRSDRFLNGKMIFNKIRVHYPFQVDDERYSKKCISSALVNLVYEGKVGRIKSPSGRYFFGDTGKHFGDDGHANPEYFEFEL
jgi:hypothetical protein